MNPEEKRRMNRATAERLWADITGQPVAQTREQKLAAARHKARTSPPPRPTRRSAGTLSLAT